MDSIGLRAALAYVTKGLLAQICPGHSSESGCDVCPQDTTSGAGKWEIKAVVSAHFVSASSEIRWSADPAARRMRMILAEAFC
jgi:hypothetical protein